MKTFHVHLVSDSTGETVSTIVRACLVQFEGIKVEEHIWSMLRTKRQLENVTREIEAHPGMVIFTLLDETLRNALQEFCRGLQIPCVAVLDPFIAAFASYLGAESHGRPGQQHVMDAEYFSRIDAINFVMSHDDGQSVVDIDEADVVLVGVSRTSKTPTSIYLANRGIKAANIPIVPGSPLPPEMFETSGPLVVGLTEDPKRLVQIRRNRMRMLKEDHDTDYTDLERVKEEVAAARRLFSENDWPHIDVTRRSIEETAAAIMQLLFQRQRQREATA